MQSLLGLSQGYWMVLHADEAHPWALTAVLLASQPMSYALGIYVGWHLVAGHKAYYEEYYENEVILRLRLR